jgi:hypothetical protein
MSGIIPQLHNSDRFVSSSPISMIRIKAMASNHPSWMSLSDLRDDPRPRETLDNPRLLVQTTTETVTSVVTDTITKCYESVSYITQTKYFGVERPTTVYEAITVEPCVLPTITAHASPSDCVHKGTTIPVVVAISWAFLIATVFFVLGIKLTEPARDEKDKVPANVAKGPTQRLPDMKKRAVPGPTTTRPPYNHSSSPKSIWYDAGTAAVDRDSPHVLQSTLETVMTIM